MLQIGHDLGLIPPALAGIGMLLGQEYRFSLPIDQRLSGQRMLLPVFPHERIFRILQRLFAFLDERMAPLKRLQIMRRRKHGKNLRAEIWFDSMDISFHQTFPDEGGADAFVGSLHRDIADIDEIVAGEHVHRIRDFFIFYEIRILTDQVFIGAFRKSLRQSLFSEHRIAFFRNDLYDAILFGLYEFRGAGSEERKLFLKHEIDDLDPLALRQSEIVCIPISGFQADDGECCKMLIVRQ